MAPTVNNHILPTTLVVRQQSVQDVPFCARQCFDHFKSTGYSCDADDLSCLCSQYSTQGLTLGELAYACSQTNCDRPSPDQNKALYNICSGQRDAVAATNTKVLTLPSYTTTSISKKTTASSFSTTSPSSAPATVTSAVSSNPTPIGSHTHAPSTDLPPMPAQGSTEQATNLTSAQSVGISIAAMGGLCLAGALIYLLVWCKRRRAFKSPKSRKDSFDFIDKGAPRHSPFKHGHADPRGPLGGFSQTRVELGDGIIESNWRAQQRKLYPELHPQSQSHRSISPESRSHESLRTVSQLLPEKAGHTPPQPPYKSPRAPSVFSTATVFEEDGKTPKLLSPATMFPMPVAPKPVLRSVPGRPVRPDQPTFSAIFTASPVEMRTRQSIASSPTKSVRKELTPAPLRNITPPAVPQKSLVPSGRPLSTEFRVSTHQSLRPPSSVPSYMPDYYTSNDSRSPTFDMVAPPRRRPVPPPCPPAKSSHPPRSYRCSGGSETSFESNDPDEITPPEEIDRHLSPVPEGDSPTSNVRYPKVPRSSNQAVPRSPQPAPSPSYCQHSKVWPLRNDLNTPPPANPQTPPNPRTPSHKHCLSGSTLAAKRLGPSAATSLSAGLHIKTSSNPQASPLKGYGRPANSTSSDMNNSNNYTRAPPSQQRKPSYAGTGYGPDPSKEPRTPEMTGPGSKIVTTDREVLLKSPLWERKLTPTRRGDDLYLSVGLASPGLAPGGGVGRGMVDSRRR
jgi:hypothetical protein